MTGQMEENSERDPDIREMLFWIEFTCWTGLVLTPLIFWLQGPSVSHDQFVVRLTLFIVVTIGGIGCRVRAIVRRFRSRRKHQESPRPKGRQHVSEPNSHSL
jgi:hypothetical protein